jgi:hypothetical protein
MESIQKSLKGSEIGEAQQHGSLAMLPLLASSEGGVDYLLAGEALRSGVARVTEVSESGHVPELKFSNLADLPVLILEGEELVGAKQNRTTMLPKLVRSYAVDAIRVDDGSGSKPGAGRARAFLDAAAAATVESYPAVGLGTTVRLSADGLVGGGLVHDDRLVHLAAFAVERQSSADRDNGRGLASLSARRRSYRH